MAPRDLDLVLRDHLESLRRWGIRATLNAYRQVDPADLDRSFQMVAVRMQRVYGSAVVNALNTTDEYMWLLALLHDLDYRPDWRRETPEAPLRLFGGTPFARWMALAPAGVKRLIGEGMTPAQAVDVSRARAAQQVASGPLQRSRSTTWNRFVADARQQGGVFDRYQRVPSPGACDFCLMLATRTDYRSTDSALFTAAGDRYHLSCRCTVRMVAKGSPAAISRADYIRLTTRNADGDLPAFGMGRYRHTAADFRFDVVDAPPPVAAWRRAA